MGMTRQRQQAPVATSRWLRSARRRGALLVAVWALSGIWHVGHDVAHQTDDAEHHVAQLAEGPAVSMAASHDHGHSHPDSSPVLSTGKGSEFESSALLAPAPNLPCQAQRLRFCTRTAPAHAGPLHASASGPRAPPIS